jgi:hypothetical protein
VVVLSFIANLNLVYSQSIAVGVKGGIRATDDVSGFSVQSSESKRYIIGPAVDIRLPRRLGFEVDALYRRFGYTSTFSSCCGSSITRERANSWEFPLILKYRFPSLAVSPYAGAGYVPRMVHGSRVSSGRYLSGMTSNPPADVYTYYFNQQSSIDYPVTHGVTAAGGIEFGGRHLRLSPEFRFVHWNSPFLQEVGGDGSYFIESSQNEFFILLGITWR